MAKVQLNAQGAAIKSAIAALEGDARVSLLSLRDTNVAAGGALYSTALQALDNAAKIALARALVVTGSAGNTLRISSNNLELEGYNLTLAHLAGLVAGSGVIVKTAEGAIEFYAVEAPVLATLNDILAGTDEEKDINVLNLMQISKPQTLTYANPFVYTLSEAGNAQSLKPKVVLTGNFNLEITAPTGAAATGPYIGSVINFLLENSAAVARTLTFNSSGTGLMTLSLADDLPAAPSINATTGALTLVSVLIASATRAFVIGSRKLL